MSTESENESESSEDLQKYMLVHEKCNKKKGKVLACVSRYVWNSSESKKWVDNKNVIITSATEDPKPRKQLNVLAKRRKQNDSQHLPRKQIGPPIRHSVVEFESPSSSSISGSGDEDDQEETSESDCPSAKYDHKHPDNEGKTGSHGIP